MTTLTSGGPLTRPPLCLRRPLLRPLCVRALVAERVVRRVADRVPVDLVLPDGSTLGARPRDPARPGIALIRPTAVFERLAHHPKLGIGEGYMAGDWGVVPGTDLAAALVPFAERMTTAVPPGLLRLRRIVDRAIPAVQRNSRHGARRNVSAHYDLSNELFAAFLDDSLTYSAALFDGAAPWTGQDLRTAQERKIDRVLDLAGVGAGTSVLEIGTGWGALAVRAAERGARVTTITLSAEQAELARRRIAIAGLTDRARVLICDYRDATGSFDAVVSVEMIEAVGEEYWPRYFRAVRDRLRPGGRAVIQAIVMSDERYRATRHSFGWIQKYIFPGGLIPSPEALDRAASEAGLRTTVAGRFGPHYAETLRRWRERFTDNAAAVSALGFGEEFRRMWEFYLAYCQAGFAAGYLDVAHLVLD